MITAKTVEIPRAHFLALSDLAASFEAIDAVRSLAHGSEYGHPGDILGSVLSEAWRVDPTACTRIMATYISHLRTECERVNRNNPKANLAAPTLEKVLKVLPFGINEGRHPWMTEDVWKQLVKQLGAEVASIL
ncbi:hypothetical protein SA2016_0840 [Sinomonas atrocyanea]|uniref:Uncharacterized protein n=1 Tax=Sinomonas atrocyanea TaxID=37927 RepID=A0A126ZWH7_9MICC|nr:hypothetical protein [Sinomonas atrocyanea]AMM31528.1 hypothetical protein SA2016_0840 [Sinomonas atrocyanea]GEB65094.1 hypothetical protein SAT01_25420 [Sinomonas atrocyanea]GGG63390.1 hypothetical protein GCM10007172_13310 [Sinomonas atrocyanea]